MDTNTGASDSNGPSDAYSQLLKGLPVVERRLDLAGVSTAVLEGGEGPPIVLLHGQGGFGAMWGPLLTFLSDNHHIVAPDLPGLGRSRVQTGTLDDRGTVAWLDELIAKTCDQPPIVIGHSLGGSLALRFAIEHGERIRSVVLINSGSLAKFRPSPSLLFALIRMMKRPSPATLKRFQRHIFIDPERAMAQMGERRAPFESYQIYLASNPSVRNANRQLLRSIAARIPDDQLRKIDVPVALIWGRGDRINRIAMAEAASARYGWTLYPIEDAAHVPMAEQPAAFLDALHVAIQL